MEKDYFGLKYTEKTTGIKKNPVHCKIIFLCAHVQEGVFWNKIHTIMYGMDPIKRCMQLLSLAEVTFLRRLIINLIGEKFYM